MSTRKKFDNFLKLQGSVKRTPKIVKKDVPTASTRKKMRKVRQTNELFCFNSSGEGNFLSNTSPPFAPSPVTQHSTSSHSVIDLTSPDFSIPSSDDIAQCKLLCVKKENTFIRQESKFFGEDKENSVNIPKTSSPNIVVKDLEKRKIVKARRILKPKICVDSTQESNVDSKVSQKCEDQKVPKKLSGEVVVKLLSPSMNNEQPGPLHFDCSQEELRPSTRGSVEIAKRRTYELEDSVTDISFLKSVSKRDSIRLSSFNTTESNSFESLAGSKVTQRRRWDKSNNFSPIIFGEKSEPRIQTSMPTRSPAVSTKKPRSTVKVPNFAAIHKKAFDKVESIVDYKKRKEERARMLLSGLKPKQSPQNSGTKESRKQLRFAPDTTPREKSPTFIPLPCTPLPRHRLTADSPKNLKSSPAPTKIPPFRVAGVEQSQAAAKAPAFKFANFKPIFDFTDHIIQQNRNVAFTPKNEKKGFSKAFKYGFGFAKPPSAGGAPVQAKIITAKNAQHNLIKAVATKSKPAENLAEKRRCAIKGVRSNRRFDLLMGMRKGK